MPSSNLFFLDVETTGLDESPSRVSPEIRQTYERFLELADPAPIRYGIVQIGGIVETGGGIRERVNWHVGPFPGDEWSRESVKIHGITRRRAAGFPSPGEMHGKVVGMLSRHVRSRRDRLTLVAYNAQFDMEFLFAFFAKCGDWDFSRWFRPDPLDICPLARTRLPGLPNYKLCTVAEELGIAPVGRWHDAANDVEVERKVFHRLERLRKRGAR